MMLMGLKKMKINSLIIATAFVSVALIAPHSTAGETYFESGTSNTLLIKHTTESGHYFQGRFKSPRHDEDDPDALASEDVEENWLGEGAFGFEYGYNFNMGNIVLTPHASIDVMSDMVTYFGDKPGEGSGPERWIAETQEFTKLTIGLDAKYYLPLNFYASVGSHTGLVKVKDEWSRQATVSLGWVEPHSKVSVEVGYRVGQAIDSKVDGSGIGVHTQELHELDGAFMNVGWKF